MFSISQLTNNTTMKKQQELSDPVDAFDLNGHTVTIERADAAQLAEEWYSDVAYCAREAAVYFTGVEGAIHRDDAAEFVAARDFEHSNEGEEFINSGDERNTSTEILQAIAFFALNDEEAEEIWEGDYPDRFTERDLIEQLKKYPAPPDGRYFWGAEGLFKVA